jgi:hypothetical protein
MGWVVIDTNQAIRAKPSFISSLLMDMEGFILSPFVLGELWNSNNYGKTIETLAKYPLRLAMTPGEVMYRVASLRRSQIVAFRPSHNLSPQKVQQGLLNPSDREIQKFVGTVIPHIRAAEGFFLSARQRVRDMLRAQGHNPHDFKFAGYSDVLQRLAVDPGNMIEWIITESVSEGGKRNVKASPQALYTAAMQNPYLWHFFNMFLWYIISFQQAWTHTYREGNISPKKDDWTDLTLSLYAAPNDIILTADGTVRKAVSAVNPDGAVRTALVEDL